MKKIFFILFTILVFANQTFADEYTIKYAHGKYGIENSTIPQMILPYIYDEISLLKEDVYRVRQNDNVGIFDTSTENFMLPVEFDYSAIN